MRDWFRSKDSESTRFDKIVIGLIVGVPVAVAGAVLALVLGTGAGGDSTRDLPTSDTNRTQATEPTASTNTTRTVTQSREAKAAAAVARCRESFKNPPESTGVNGDAVDAAGPLGPGTHSRQLDTNPDPSGSATAFFGVCPASSGQLKISAIPKPAGCSDMTLNIDDEEGELLRQASPGPSPTEGHGGKTRYQVEAGGRYLIEVNSCPDVQYDLSVEPSSIFG